MVKYRRKGELDVKYTMVTKQIENTIIENNLIDKSEHIVLGLSGGPDSVCLFHALNGLGRELGITLHVVHINHKFRPGAAEDDQAYVEQLCKAYNIDCRVFTFDCPAIAAELGITGEEAGRKVRYEAFYKTAMELMRHKHLSRIKIAVAHNMNDQAETLFIRLIRGTGTDGLAGMEYKRAVKYDEIISAVASVDPEDIPKHLIGCKQDDTTGIDIIRPLLDVERADIEKYCVENKLNPRIDLTNLEPVYTRNKVRLDLIPYINEKFGGDISGSLNRLAKIAGEDKEYLWLQARHARENAKLSSREHHTMGSESMQIYDCETLRDMHPSIRHRVILDIFSDMGLVQDISNAHLIAADRILVGGQTGKIAEFPQGFKITISYGTAVFSGKISLEGDTYADWRKETRKRSCLKASLLTTSEWEKKKKENNRLYNRANLGNAYAVFDYKSLCCEYNVSDKLPENWASMTEPQRTIFLQRKLSILKRERRKGDFLALTALGGTKKIQDYFVDVKVPREMRQSIELVVRGSEVLWVIDDEPQKELRWGRTSGKYKVLATTESILLLELVPIL